MVAYGTIQCMSFYGGSGVPNYLIPIRETLHYNNSL